MVGLVVVSHSEALAEGIVALAREMGGPDLALEAAGGMDEPGALGTDAERVRAAQPGGEQPALPGLERHGRVESRLRRVPSEPHAARQHRRRGADLLDVEGEPHAALRRLGQLGHHAEDAHVDIEVCDNGHTIPPETVRRIFEPFEPIGDDMEMAEGSGLGLVVARRLVEMHGGEIAARSRAGQGTAYKISLPNLA